MRVVKKQEAENAEHEALAEATRRQRAESVLGVAQSERQALELEVSDGARRERERMVEGLGTAWDLAQAGAFEARARREIERRRKAENALESAVRIAKRDESAAIARAARARNGVDALERHRGAFVRLERRRLERAGEEASQEAWESGRGRLRGGSRR